MIKPSSVYFTAPSAAVAERIARKVLVERLAVCVNILPAAVSLYRWKGRVERSGEVVCFAKTVATRLSGLMARIEALHPYETPALFVLTVARANRAALAWLESEANEGKGRPVSRRKNAKGDSGKA